MIHRLELTFDQDKHAPFYSCFAPGNTVRHDWWICLSGLNDLFDPPIPGDVGRFEIPAEYIPPYIEICTSPTLPDRAWYGGFKIDENGYVDHDHAPSPMAIRRHLKRRYMLGDRWAWIEYPTGE